MTIAKDYIDRRMYKKTGFLQPVDAMAISGLGTWQAENGIRGALMEIGVFYGRSLVLMAKTSDMQKEEIVACDLFDIGVHDSGDSDQLTYFKRLLRDENIPESAVKIIQGDSAKIDPNTLKALEGKVRLFSVDGGHEYHHVETDSRIASQLISADGIIMFDDFFNSQYPDVTIAVLDFLKQNQETFVPFLITANKLYVCRQSAVSKYQRAVFELKLWAGAKLDKFNFMNREIVYLYQPLADRVIYQMSARVGLGSAASRLMLSRRDKFSRQ